jgi:hypothetical protein
MNGIGSDGSPERIMGAKYKTSWRKNPQNKNVAIIASASGRSLRNGW